jgi:UDP-GlcNAc:undecaprenyl-phosphate/decaprenyl-phosphate GlcNAc-1-phosphate transferase
VSGAVIVEFLVALAAGLFGGLPATIAALRAAPAGLVRTNVNGHQVPVVLGFGLAVGAVAGAFALVAATSFTEPRALDPSIDFSGAGIVIGIVGVMFAAGLYDDRRGDEPARGFRGHLGAARGGALTGGLVKIAAGGLAGLIATLPLAGPLDKLEVFLLVPLAANLFNLLDRAPGRAAKMGWLFLVPLLAFGSEQWGLAAAGLTGALLAVTPFDVRERGMLGDAGANPLGAIVGLGLALSLPEPWLALSVVMMLALNAISERVSFSTVIDSSPWLRALDRIGRR